MLKKKVLISLFLSVGFGLFVWMGKVEAIQCCLKEIGGIQGFTGSIDCRVKNDGTNCETTKTQPGSCAGGASKVLMEWTPVGSFTANSVYACPGSNPLDPNFVYEIESEVECMSTEVCKDAIKTQIKDCTLLKTEPECNLRKSTGCTFKDGQCLESWVAETVVTPPEAGAGCQDPLGCYGLRWSSLNKINVAPGTAGVQTLIGRVIKTVMGVVGSIALIMFVYGGLMWMTASGNTEKISKAMRIITWSTLGIIVILSSYALVDFIFTSI